MRASVYTHPVVGRADPGFFRRMWAMVVKEFVQMRRDRMTFATMVFIPILQLVLFGYAITPTRSICRRPCSCATTGR